MHRRRFLKLLAGAAVVGTAAPYLDLSAPAAPVPAWGLPALLNDGAFRNNYRGIQRQYIITSKAVRDAYLDLLEADTRYTLPDPQPASGTWADVERSDRPFWSAQAPDSRCEIRAADRAGERSKSPYLDAYTRFRRRGRVRAA